MVMIIFITVVCTHTHTHTHTGGKGEVDTTVAHSSGDDWMRTGGHIPGVSLLPVYMCSGHCFLPLLGPVKSIGNSCQHVVNMPMLSLPTCCTVRK